MYRINDQTRQMACNFSLPITSPVNSTMTSAGFYDSSSYRESYSISTPNVTSPIDNTNQYYLNNVNNVSSNGFYNDSLNYQNGYYLNQYYSNQMNNMESTNDRSTSNPPNYIERQDSLMPSILSTRKIHVNPSILLSNHQTRYSNQNPLVSSSDTDYTNDSQSSQNDYDVKTKSTSPELRRRSSRDKKSPRPTATSSRKARRRRSRKRSDASDASDARRSRKRSDPSDARRSSRHKKSPRSTASLATISRRDRRRRSRKRSDALKECIDKIRAIDDNTKKIKPKCIDARVLLNAKAKYKDQLSTITNNLIDVLESRTQSVDKTFSPIELNTTKKNSLAVRSNRYSPIRYDDSEDDKNTSSSSKNNQKTSVSYKLIKIEKTEVDDDHEAPWD
ncbi:uncharacterized protein DDB_G0287625-like [Aphidius gifuensis]|uniref:uncharacterized protein DDB_G0287625-like n=1 Tax=Aphidius gifuensis TaxID=684658 RepID=UPI001CDB6582|nr:uncharacterized protein DDB_G0287625-like [Aphidius gifuensis]